MTNLVVFVLFGFGFGYTSWDDAGATATYMTLPSATVAVEAGLTDWATVRASVGHTYAFSCSADVGSLRCTDGDVGPSGNNTLDYAFGLGFDWGQVTLDMTVGNNLFTNPVATIVGFENLDSGAVTLSYTF